MQNNPEKKSGSFRRMVKEKGYYIVLFLCVLAVGISGYLFIKTTQTQRRAAAVGETLSVPLTPETTKETRKQPAAQAAVSAAPAESAAAAVPETAAASAEPAAVAVVAPLAGDTVGAYSMDKLSYNATMRDWRTHNGVDIAAEAGAKVAAACAGTVASVYDDDALGRVVTISHDGGYVTTYASLDEDTLVSPGDKVAAGDVIGTVGTTAKLELSEGPHLHFSVTRSGEPVDPSTLTG